jgi:hypothetical protein
MGTVQSVMEGTGFKTTKWKAKAEKTSDTMERLCSVISVTDLSRPNIGRDGDYDET